MTTARPKRFDRHVDGIVLLDKPQGMSSNAALQQVRGLYRALKAGHAGSLDPLATGMLPICLGQATKVCGYLLDSAKTYRVIMQLGVRTDSADADGQVLEVQPIPPLDAAGIGAVMARFLGPQQQIPPMFSALKQDGKRLYELARRGETVERAARQIVIERLSLIGHTAATIEFEVRCSKGTYVRSLVEDLATGLGTVAHVTLLRRLQVDPFDAARMISYDALAARSDAERLALLQPADSALVSIPALQLDVPEATALGHGKVQASAAPAGLHRAYGPQATFLGLVRVNDQAELRAERLFTPIEADG